MKNEYQTPEMQVKSASTSDVIRTSDRPTELPEDTWVQS